MKIDNNFINRNFIQGLESNESNKTSSENGGSFLDILSSKLDSVNDKQVASEETTQKYILGEEKDIHNVMISTEEAKMSLELAVQVRNKIVEAYQEISRMQL